MLAIYVLVCECMSLCVFSSGKKAASKLLKAERFKVEWGERDGLRDVFFKLPAVLLPRDARSMGNAKKKVKPTC